MLAASDEILVVAGRISPPCVTPRTCSAPSSTAAPTTRRRACCSTAAAWPSGRRSAPPSSPRLFDVPLAATIPFDPALFGTAANNGQMIAEVQPGSKVAELFNDLAAAAIGRVETRRKSGSASLLEPLLAKLAARRKAS